MKAIPNRSTRRGTVMATVYVGPEFEDADCRGLVWNYMCQARTPDGREREVKTVAVWRFGNEYSHPSLLESDREPLLDYLRFWLNPAMNVGQKAALDRERRLLDAFKRVQVSPPAE